MIRYITLDSNERSGFNSREQKHVPIEKQGNLVHLVLRGCHKNPHNVYNQVGIVGIRVMGKVIRTVDANAPVKKIEIPSVTPVTSLPSHLKNELEVKIQSSVNRLEKLKKERASLEDFTMAGKIKEGLGVVYALLIAFKGCEKCMRDAAAAEDYALASRLKSERDIKRDQANFALQEVEKQFFGSDKLADEPSISHLEAVNVQSHSKHHGPLSAQEVEKKFNTRTDEMVREFSNSAIKDEPSSPQSKRSFAETGIRSSLTNNSEASKKESRIVDGEHPLLGVENATELPAPDEISEFAGNASSDLIQKCEELFGAYRMKCFFSKNWALREAALSKMTLLIPEICSSTNGDCAEVVCKIIEIGICDINMQVYLAALVMLDESLLQFETIRLPQEKITPPLSRIIIILLDKLTDSKPKIVDSAELAILSMASSSCTDNASIIRAATKRIRSKESKDGRTVKARLTFLESFAAEFGTGIPWRRIVDFAISSNAFEHKDGGVRDSAKSLIVTLMAVHGDDCILASIKNSEEVSERQVSEFRARFDMIKNI
ncbi:hypothetical protein ACHAXA_007404 [Cyclostephanos tholiformis]|uniref:TOG domain-containing protein n=1 Tax=Cyclostephanos tholiformis TaxID=382380 RepID=A0ABD3REE7_9STRA